MIKTIDINLIKEEPKLFFSQLSQKAEEEFYSLLNYFIFKYNIEINIKNESKLKSKEKSEFLSFLKKGFSVSEKEIHDIEQTQNEINKWKIQEF